MISACRECSAASNPLSKFGMLIVDMSVKLPGKAKQNNLPPECGQPTDGGESANGFVC
jgi:hypothetical protein